MEEVMIHPARGSFGSGSRFLSAGAWFAECIGGKSLT